MRRPGPACAALLAAALLFPAAARALLAASEAPAETGSAAALERRGTECPGDSARNGSLQRVEKRLVRIAPAPEGRVPALLPEDRAPRVEAAPPPDLETSVELTKPDSLRIFLPGTPHSHRAPPA